jgi:hypothetical protein
LRLARMHACRRHTIPAPGVLRHQPLAIEDEWASAPGGWEPAHASTIEQDDMLSALLLVPCWGPPNPLRARMHACGSAAAIPALGVLHRRLPRKGAGVSTPSGRVCPPLHSFRSMTTQSELASSKNACMPSAQQQSQHQACCNDSLPYQGGSPHSTPSQGFACLCSLPSM